MAGGPNAETVMCIACLGRALRVDEGIENDSYRCTECVGAFMIHWDEGPPSEPRWPPTDEELTESKRILKLMGRTIPAKIRAELSLAAEATNRQTWRECQSCGKAVPTLADGRYVCGFCRHCPEEMRGEEGGMPPDWGNAKCPYCREVQPVLSPHRAKGCDFTTLDCVHCQLRSRTPCTCTLRTG